jgi:AcrR family transcriptional regulator
MVWFIAPAFCAVNTLWYGIAMTTGSPAAKRPRDERNSKADWVRAGLSLLMKNGIGGVRIEQAATRLGVTKGSFYWHFADAADFHRAMLAEWQTTATNDVIARIDQDELKPRARLQKLYEETTGNPKVARLETAVRSWAAKDRSAEKAVADVDQARTTYIAGLMREMGFDAVEAQSRSQAIYLMVIGGYFVAATSGAFAPAALWPSLEALTARTA